MNEDISQMSDDEIDAEIARLSGGDDGGKLMSEMTDEELDNAIREASSGVPYGQEQTRAPEKEYGMATPGVRVDETDFVGEKPMSGSEKAGLEIAAQSGTDAYEGGGFLNGLGAVGYNMGGARAADNWMQKNAQELASGVKKVNGQLKRFDADDMDESEIDWTLDAMGANGVSGWLRKFLGGWASKSLVGDENLSQQWEREEGHKYKDPREHKRAKLAWAQGIARGMVGQREEAKANAQEELKGRETSTFADVVDDLITQGGYSATYVLPGYGAAPLVISALSRAGELSQDDLRVDKDGNIVVENEGDDMGRAFRKGTLGAAKEVGVEYIDGKLAMKGLGKVGSYTLGRIPLLKQVGEKVAATPVGVSYAKYKRLMDNVGRMTGVNSLPEEYLEEFEDQLLESVMGTDRRDSEIDGTTAYSRIADDMFGKVNKETGERDGGFFGKDNQKNLVRSLLVMQALQGGPAKLMDIYNGKYGRVEVRTDQSADTKPEEGVYGPHGVYERGGKNYKVITGIDDQLKDIGVPASELKYYTTEEKIRAYCAWVDNLNEAEVKGIMDDSVEYVNKLLDTVRQNAGRFNLDEADGDAPKFTMGEMTDATDRSGQPVKRYVDEASGITIDAREVGDDQLGFAITDGYGHESSARTKEGAEKAAAAMLKKFQVNNHKADVIEDARRRIAPGANIVTAGSMKEAVDKIEEAYGKAAADSLRNDDEFVRLMNSGNGEAFYEPSIDAMVVPMNSIRTQDDVLRLFTHEGTHGGWAKMFGDGARGGESAFVDLMRKSGRWLNDQGKDARSRDFDWNRAVDEYMAYNSERLRGGASPIDKLIGGVRKWWRDNVNEDLLLDDHEIVMMMDAMRDKYMAANGQGEGKLVGGREGSDRVERRQRDSLDRFHRDYERAGEFNRQMDATRQRAETLALPYKNQPIVVSPDGTAVTMDPQQIQNASKDNNLPFQREMTKKAGNMRQWAEAEAFRRHAQMAQIPYKIVTPQTMGSAFKYDQSDRDPSRTDHTPVNPAMNWGATVMSQGSVQPHEGELKDGKSILDAMKRGERGTSTIKEQVDAELDAIDQENYAKDAALWYEAKKQAGGNIREANEIFNGYRADDGRDAARERAAKREDERGAMEQMEREEAFPAEAKKKPEPNVETRNADAKPPVVSIDKAEKSVQAAPEANEEKPAPVARKAQSNVSRALKAMAGLRAKIGNVAFLNIRRDLINEENGKRIADAIADYMSAMNAETAAMNAESVPQSEIVRLREVASSKAKAMYKAINEVKDAKDKAKAVAETRQEEKPSSEAHKNAADEDRQKTEAAEPAKPAEKPKANRRRLVKPPKSEQAAETDANADTKRLVKPPKAGAEQLRDLMRDDPVLNRINAAYGKAKTDTERQALQDKFKERVEELKNGIAAKLAKNAKKRPVEAPRKTETTTPPEAETSGNGGISAENGAVEVKHAETEQSKAYKILEDLQRIASDDNILPKVSDAKLIETLNDPRAKDPKYADLIAKVKAELERRNGSNGNAETASVYENDAVKSAYDKIVYANIDLDAAKKKPNNMMEQVAIAKRRDAARNELAAALKDVETDALEKAKSEILSGITPEEVKKKGYLAILGRHSTDMIHAIEKELKARESEPAKTEQKKASTADTSELDSYLAGKKPMDAARIRKTLEKNVDFGGKVGVTTEAELVDRYAKDGDAVIRADVSTSRNGKPTVFFMLGDNVITETAAKYAIARGVRSDENSIARAKEHVSLHAAVQAHETEMKSKGFTGGRIESYTSDKAIDDLLLQRRFSNPIMPAEKVLAKALRDVKDARIKRGDWSLSVPVQKSLIKPPKSSSVKSDSASKQAAYTPKPNAKKAAEVVKDFVVTDKDEVKLRPHLSNVYHDKDAGRVVATDGRHVIATKHGFDPNAKEPDYYPDWRQVIPDEKSMTDRIKVNPDDLVNIAKKAARLDKALGGRIGGVVVFNFGDRYVKLDAKRMATVAKAMSANGIDEIMANGMYHPIMAKNADTTIALMPLRSNGVETVGREGDGQVVVDGITGKIISAPARSDSQMKSRNRLDALKKDYAAYRARNLKDVSKYDLYNAVVKARKNGEKDLKKIYESTVHRPFDDLRQELKDEFTKWVNAESDKKTAELVAEYSMDIDKNPINKKYYIREIEKLEKYLAVEDEVDSLMMDEAEAKKVLGQADGKAAKNNGTTRFSVNFVDYAEWNSILDSYVNGEIGSKQRVTVAKNTPAVLMRLGVPDLPVTITGHVIDKITGKVPTGSGEFHGIPVDELRELQIELDNPIAVFESRTQPDSFVLYTRMVDSKNNERAVVAIKVGVTATSVSINPIMSAYGRSQFQIQNWVDLGALRYVNKQARKTYARRLQLPGDSVLRARHVLTENDFSAEQLGIIKYPVAKVNLENTAFSIVTPEQDAAYMDAVNRGDMETARRMVREAAAKAMPDTKVVDDDGLPLVVTHASFDDFNVFDESKDKAKNYDIPGFYFLDKKYGSYGNRPVVKDFFLNITNPLVAPIKTKIGETSDGKPRYREDATLSQYTRNGHYVENKEGGLKDIGQKFLRDEGYDGAIRYHEYIVTDSSQAKSADPVTYDDDGKVIPLSQRFNPEKKDTRYSISNIYTGSAADYEKPSLQYIGTGEGEQVYGWGLYGSNKRAVAEHYVPSSMDGTSATNYEGVFRSMKGYEEALSKDVNFDLVAEELANVNGDIGRLLKVLKNYGDKYDASKTLKWIEENKNEISSKIDSIGKDYVYEQTFFTNRPAGDESHLLSWYEPVSEENFNRIVDAVKREMGFDVLKTGRNQLGHEYVILGDDPEYLSAGDGNIYLTRGITGSDAYNEISRAFGSPEEASKFLARADIDGVKYPVDSYGGKSVKNGNDAGWNYVSFRDDNIRVDHKWVDGKIRWSKASDYRTLASIMADTAGLTVDEQGALNGGRQIRNDKSNRNGLRDRNEEHFVNASLKQRIYDLVHDRHGARRVLGDFIRRKVQDYRLDLLRMEELAGVTDKGQSAYYAFDSAFGKVEQWLADIEETRLNPLMEQIANNNLNEKWDGDDNGKLTKFDALLMAMHGPERNRMIAEATMNSPNGPTLDGSGRTTAYWNEVKAKLDAEGFTAKAQTAMDMVHDIMRLNRQLMVASGLMSNAQASEWERLSPNYVPLRDEDGQDSTFGQMMWKPEERGGGGRSYGKRESPQAMGRKTLADSPVVMALSMLERTVSRAADNDARQKLAEIVKNDARLGHVADETAGTGWQVPMRQVKTPNGFITTVPDVNAIEQKYGNVVAYKQDGVLKYIVLGNDQHRDASGELDGVPTQTANRIGMAVKKQSLAESGPMVSFFRSLTRAFGVLRTSASPTFLLSNGLADNGQAFRNILSSHGIKTAKDFEKAVPGAMAAARRLNKGKSSLDMSKEMDRYAKEWAENGGRIGGMNISNFREMEDRAKSQLRKLERKMGRHGTSVKDAAQDAWDWIQEFGENLNAPVEMGTRLAVYAAMRRNGMSVADAVSYSRDVTVNFNRKGEWTPILNALYAFSNASIQDLHRSGVAALGKHGAATLFTMSVLGFVSAMLGYGQDDPEEEREGEKQWKNTKEYGKQNSIGFRLGGKTYGLPLRGIARIPYYIGHKAFEVINGNSSAVDAAAKSVGFAVDNLIDPIGSAPTIGQTLSPSVIRPGVEIMENVKFSGQQMYRNPMNEQQVRSEMGRSSTGSVYKFIARQLNAITGGNAGSRGLVDMQPEKVEALWNWIGGSLSRDVGQVVDTLSDLAQFKAPDVRNVPFMSRVVRDLDVNSSRFHEAESRYLSAKKEFDAMETPEEMERVAKDAPWLMRRNARWNDELKDLRNMASKLLKEEMRAQTDEERNSINKLRMKAQYLFIHRMETPPASDAEGVMFEREASRKINPFLKSRKRQTKAEKKQESRRRNGLLP